MCAFVNFSTRRAKNKKDMLGSPFFGGQLPIGPLFDVGESGKVYKSPNLSLDNDDASHELSDRFGIARIADRTANLARSISDPAGVLNQINTEYSALIKSLKTPYQQFYIKCREAGMSLEEAAAAADDYIRPQITAHISLIQYKHPYAVGGEGPLAVGNPLAKLAGNFEFKNATKLVGDTPAIRN